VTCGVSHRFAADRCIIWLYVPDKILRIHFNTSNTTLAIQKDLNYFHQIPINLILGLPSFLRDFSTKNSVQARIFCLPYHSWNDFTTPTTGLQGVSEQTGSRVLFTFPDRKRFLHLAWLQCLPTPLLFRQMANLTVNTASLQLASLFAVCKH
jgi:hypothetical protein